VKQRWLSVLRNRTHDQADHIEGSAEHSYSAELFFARCFTDARWGRNARQIAGITRQPPSSMHVAVWRGSLLLRVQEIIAWSVRSVALMKRVDRHAPRFELPLQCADRNAQRLGRVSAIAVVLCQCLFYGRAL
jgi:hypothetical protein